MKINLSILILAFLLGLSQWGFSQSGEKIELIQADSAHYDEQKGKYIRMLMGNVKLKQGNAIMSCDRANLDDLENTFEAFGNVHIFQADTINIRGDHLLYTGNDKVARMDGNVVMIDKEMRLTTNAITYHMESRNGYYTSGGVLTSGKDKLTSVIGTYNGFSKRVGFRKDVKLVNPEYTMEGDTLIYGTISKKAWFYGPTTIESATDKIYCNYGWYNTKSEQAVFSKRARIESGANVISGDSMEYDRNSSIGRAFGNIEVFDSVENITVYGGYGWSNQNSKETQVTINPWAKKYMDGDSLYLKADTFYYSTDTLGKVLSAYRNSLVFKTDVQAVCDSLTYSMKDSTMNLFYDPILWTDENQITGNFIALHLKENKLDHLVVEEKAFVVSKETEDKFNQISGKRMISYFKEDALDRVNVIGNGLSIYYAAEDSVNYMGVNKIECSEMLIQLDSSKVKEITFYNKPKGIFYPIDQFPENEKRLRGFRLHDGIRPKLIIFEQAN